MSLSLGSPHSSPLGFAQLITLDQKESGLKWTGPESPVLHATSRWD